MEIETAMSLPQLKGLAKRHCGGKLFFANSFFIPYFSGTVCGKNTVLKSIFPVA